MQVINDVFVFAYMQGNKFFVGYCFGLDVFSSVSVFQGVNGLLELSTGGTHVDDHDSFAIASQGIFEKSGQF